MQSLKQIKAEPAPPPGDRPTVTIHPHWCHITSTVAHSGSLVCCSTLGGAFDHDH